MNELMTIKDNKPALADYAAEELAKIEIAKKDLEAKEKELKAALLEAMTESDIISIENMAYGVSVKRIEAFTRESLDSKKLREEKPEIYDKYVKISEVKPSVRITVK